MKVLFDHQIFSYQEYGGVSRYHCEILKRMQRNEYDVSVKYSNNHYLKELGTVSFSPFFPNWHWRRKHRLMLELGKIHSLNVIKQDSFDVLHITHYESYALNKTRKPIVMTYHDKQFSSYQYNARTVREQKKCFERVDAVIAISENTKKDIIELFNYPEDRIRVIYHGIDIVENTYESIIGGDYILFVGMRWVAYKNFRRFLQAFAELKEKDVKLFCAGGGAFSSEELDLIRDLGLDGRVMQKNVSDNELNALYQNALLFCFPSVYEGFGMPLLEAMSNGCPVVCSDTSSFPEVAGNAAVYFDPLKRGDILSAMETVLSSQEVRDNLKRAGFDNARKFSWDESVRKHCDLYRSLI